MNETLEAAALLAEVKAGDQQAANELFQRFANRLVGLARSRINPDLRRKVDPEDVMQSAFASFFRRHGAGEYDVQSWESLWSLLTVITIRKCGFKIRYYRTQKRSAGRELSAVRYTEDSSIHWEAVAKDPTPSHAAMLTETLEELLNPLEVIERQMLTLHLQGNTHEEIGLEVRRSERTVRRVLDRIRTQMEERCDLDG